MTARETNVAIAAESTLSSSLAAGATTINVTDTSSFPAVPFYVVIDPDQNATREVVLVDGSKTATTFVLSAATSRGLDGTSDTDHSAGAKVACVPVPGLWTDINDRVDALSSAAYQAGGTDVAVADGGTGASTAAGARTNLGLGTLATQSAASVAITGGSIAGITDLAVADGGTGASTAAAARTNLAVVGTVGGDTITASGAAVKGLVIKAAAAQTANLFELQDSSGAVLAAFTSIGALGSADSAPKLAGGSQTGAPAAGGWSALPATPDGYLRVIINGTTQSIPYYPAI